MTRNSQIVTLTGLPAVKERAEGEFKVQPQGKAPKNRSPARRARGWHGVRGANPAPGTSRAAQRPETERCFSFPRAPRGTSRDPEEPSRTPQKAPVARRCPAPGLVPLEGAESCAAPRPRLSMVSGVGFLLDFFSSSSFPSSSAAPRSSFARAALRAGGRKGAAGGMERIPAGMR